MGKTNTQKADAFADHLEEAFKPNDPQEEIINFQTQVTEEIALAIPQKISKEIKYNTNPKKASGFDLITGELLKKKNSYINIFNMDIWKMAEVNIVPKPEHELSSYIPISLLPVTSKLFEKLLL